MKNGEIVLKSSEWVCDPGEAGELLVLKILFASIRRAWNSGYRVFDCSHGFDRHFCDFDGI
jgi:hypothetical protein